ncbi:hypothetical protein [Deinococcus hohokamensis]|uniref:Uncharacterized protein n=1 Tax=Deinococcus hohokamensis TaxID=309883 RepID=A0ABV9I3S7_9DEIO
MSLLDEIEAAVQEIQEDPEVLEVRFRRKLTFRLKTHGWTVDCSVTDPSRVKPDELARLQAAAAERSDVRSYRDLRILRIKPGQAEPYPGATVATDDGTLEVLHWSQASDWTGQRVGTCMLRRP